MGRPKASLLGPGDETFLTLAVRALASAGADPVLIVGGEPPADTAGARHVPDLSPGRGPLAGLEAALTASPHEWVLLVACDMPRLSASLLGRLTERTLTTERRAVVPKVGGRLQPLHAVYHRSCLEAVEEALAGDRLGITAFVRDLDAQILVCEADASFDNVNTPEDLERQGLSPSDPRP
jgi:molybdopterin-guanine dinucleotide biosynthesis protein A